MDALVRAALDGRPAALGRVLSLVEDGGERARDVSGAVLGARGCGVLVGVTGPPGAGKSTLTAALVGTLRARSLRTAVLAIDPSSPFSGGALLGDRVRMLEHARDSDVFIRSMATRGSSGGLATAAPEAIRVLEAAGFEWIVLETAGVGQVDLDAIRLVDTTVVVLNPGSGDDVQAAKAGLMEIADVFVINKADRPGAEETCRHVSEVVEIRRAGSEDWTPPIVETVATHGQGLDRLVDAIEQHRTWLARRESHELRRTRHRWSQVERHVELRLAEHVRALIAGEFESIRERIAAHQIDPWTAADLIVAQLMTSTGRDAAR